jgi:fumarate hydratase class II
VQEVTGHLVPAAQGLQEAIAAKAREWHDVGKICRTHLEDAVPLTVGQEWSRYATQLEPALDRLQATLGGCTNSPWEPPQLEPA